MNNINKYLIFGVLVLVIFTSGCTSQTNQTNAQYSGYSGFKIESSAFTSGGEIPPKYTVDGGNISPPLSWSSTPANTKSFIIICEDTDAGSGTFFHWVIFNIPGNVTQLAEAIPTQGTLDNGARQGTNDFNKIGYSGPSLTGRHIYLFKIYALDTELDLDPGSTELQVNIAMQGHIIGHAQITGLYGR
jgi:Raf kinase inhibitor-like YbhB/YbcL family protein